MISRRMFLYGLGAVSMATLSGCNSEDTSSGATTDDESVRLAQESAENSASESVYEAKTYDIDDLPESSDVGFFFVEHEGVCEQLESYAYELDGKGPHLVSLSFRRDGYLDLDYPQGKFVKVDTSAGNRLLYKGKLGPVTEPCWGPVTKKEYFADLREYSETIGDDPNIELSGETEVDGIKLSETSAWHKAEATGSQSEEELLSVALESLGLRYDATINGGRNCLFSDEKQTVHLGWYEGTSWIEADVAIENVCYWVAEPSNKFTYEKTKAGYLILDVSDLSSPTEKYFVHEGSHSWPYMNNDSAGFIELV